MSIKNAEGYPDPTYGQALPAIRREENTRVREKRYGVKRGDIVYIKVEVKDDGRRNAKVSRRMQVVNLYEHHILLRHATGACESYQYNDFLQRLDRR